MDSGYFYPHNQPLNFTGNLPPESKLWPYAITLGGASVNTFTLTTQVAKTLNIDASTTVLWFYAYAGSWGRVFSPCTVTAVTGGYTVVLSSIALPYDYPTIYLCYVIDETHPDDYKRFLKLQIKDTASDYADFLVFDKVIEVAVNANYDYVFNANSYALQFLESPKLVFREDYENSDNGIFDFALSFGESFTLKKKALVINVFDFTAIIPQYCFVGYQAQGWENGNTDTSWTCLGLKNIDVYTWIGDNQYYLWLEKNVTNTIQYYDLVGNAFEAVLPVFYVSKFQFIVVGDSGYWQLTDGGGAIQPSFNADLIINGVTCIAPNNGNPAGDGTDTPASYVAPLMYNLNTNVRPSNAFALVSTRLNIKYPVLVWINLMGGLEYQQVNANEDGEGWYCKFGVRQNESVYYLDNDNRRNEIMNRGVVDTIQFNIVMKREATQESDRLAGLMVSKSVFIMYGFQQANVEAPLVPAMRQLIISRKGFQRFESDTITRVVCDAEFSQVTDIKR